MGMSNFEQDRHREFINSRQSRCSNQIIFSYFKDQVSAEEGQIILKYWSWLNAIATGELCAITEEQKDFIKMIQGQKEPYTVYEKIWKRITQLQQDEHHKIISQSNSAFRIGDKVGRYSYLGNIVHIDYIQEEDDFDLTVVLSDGTYRIFREHIARLKKFLPKNMVTTVEPLTEEEKEMINKYYEFYHSLETGERKPTTDAQKHVCAVIGSTDFENKLRKQKELSLNLKKDTLNGGGLVTRGGNKCVLRVMLK